MAILEELRAQRYKKVSEREEFANHIKRWFPVAILIGIVVGIAMSLFFIFTILISSLFKPVHPVLGMAIGGLIIWLLVRVNLEKPWENGISYVIKKKHERKPVPLNQT